jgi:hypothetical protein
VCSSDLTTHYHDSRYFTQAQLQDGTTVNADLSGLSISGTYGKDFAGWLYSGDEDPDEITRLNYNGYFYATKVHNAVYNDMADYRLLADKLVYGKCYYDTAEGVKICKNRCQKGVIGVSSNTFGFSCGIDTKQNQIPIGISGWVLAHVDREYEPGTPLTNDENGNLTEMMAEEKRNYPERLLATYSRKEKEMCIKNINVEGRHWVRIK